MSDVKRGVEPLTSEEAIELDDRFDVARLREMIYWSQEPGLLELLRGIATMPDQALARLQAFLAEVQVPEHLRVDFDAEGCLRLSVARRHS